MHGLHLIADLRRCDAAAEETLVRSQPLMATALALCQAHGLTVVGQSSHDFDGGGFTLAILLAASHICVHTWPEMRAATMDVYVCNFTRDNGESARGVARGIAAALGCAQPIFVEVQRGDIGALQ